MHHKKVRPPGGEVDISRPSLRRVGAALRSRCRTPRCRKAVLASGKSPYCSRCKTALFKEAHPLKHAFNKLKQRAIARGHGFDLSYSQFADFAHKSGWATGRGKTADSLSIDRINDAGGYHVDNIRVLTLSQNSVKESRRRYAPLPAWMRAEEEAASASSEGGPLV